jgi:hypothetical protein
MSTPKAAKAAKLTNIIGPKQIAEGEKKAGDIVTRANAQRALAAGYLAEVKAGCSAAGYRAFLKTWTPNLKRSRVAELIAIAVGKKTVEQSKAETRARVAKHRAAKLSVTAPVTENPPVTLLGKGTVEAAPQKPSAPFIEPPAEDRAMRWKAANAAFDTAPPETPSATTIRNELLPVPPAAEPEAETPARAAARSAPVASALNRFKAMVDECLPRMNLDELDEAEKHFRAVATPIRGQLAVDAGESAADAPEMPADGSIPPFLRRTAPDNQKAPA